LPSAPSNWHKCPSSKENGMGAPRGALGRFDGRADAYSKYRPRYPQKVLAILKREAGFDRTKVVADVAAGTGILSELFLGHGNLVYSVEPNEDMRRRAERELHGFRRSHLVTGTAEATTLEEGSVDLVSVGQALHWFDPGKARKEFSRILKEDGWVCILYNDRRKKGGFDAAYEGIVRRHEVDLASAPDVDRDYVARFLGNGTFKEFHMPNPQTLDLLGVLGRLESASYMPRRGTPGHREMEKEAREAFARHSRGGRVRFVYDTRMYLGKISGT
jgi:ubiquinone/menaquinone biosynthesis C-methylase UbiE